MLVLAGCGSDEATKQQPSFLPKVEAPPAQFKEPVKPAEGADGVAAERVGPKFKVPTSLAFLPDSGDEFLVTERDGRVVQWAEGDKQAAVVLDLKQDVETTGYEQGLLGIALAPDYATSRRVYIAYTDHDHKLTVESFEQDQDSRRADPASRQVIYRSMHPKAPPGKAGLDARVHNGGQLQFGPDGMLYIALGDGGPQNDPRNQAQQLNTDLGKILRIDPSAPADGKAYGVPADNPFVKQSGARPEIWVYGLRNPFRFSFDSATGDMYIGDVGGAKVEEINLVPKGQKGLNFGWRCYEGNLRLNGCEPKDHVRPLIDRPGSELTKQVVSIIGGYVVHDPALAALDGRYVYSEFYSGELRAAKVVDGKVTEDKRLGLQIAPIASFAQDGEGRVYTISLFNGLLHRLVPAA
jgi:glucose/arabinose dehydrogenase